MNEAHRSEEIRQRAARLAGGARDRVEDAVHHLDELLGRRSDLTDAIREHPTRAAAALFLLGFTSAALSGRRRRNWIITRLRRQARTVILGGIASSLAHEVRELVISDEGLGRWFSEARHEHERGDEDDDVFVEEDLDTLYEDDFI